MTSQPVFAPTLSSVLFSCALILLSGSVASGQGRVTIPAQSSSTLEGGAGVSVPGATLPSGGTNNFPGKKGVPRVQGPPVSQPATVTTSPVRISDAPIVEGEIAAMQTVEPVKRNFDPKVQKRLAELRRELSISEAALVARITLPADAVFQEEARTVVDDRAAGPTLTKVAEYLRLSPKKDVTVQTFYVEGGENAKGIAWSRSLALLEWLVRKGEVPGETLRASGPAPVTKPTAKADATAVGETEFVSRIEITLR